MHTPLETPINPLQLAFSLLLIDDSEEDCYALRRLLSRSRTGLAFDIREAGTGARGLALCRERMPDCLLLDYSLGDTDGLSLLAELNAGRDPDDDPICPVVILTGAGTVAQIAVRALKEGAQDYLVKEMLTPEGVGRAIENAVEKVRLRRELHRSEEHYRLLVEGAKDYAMILMDVEGRVTGWNLGAERLMGWSASEMQGQHVDLIFTPEDSSSGIPARNRERAATEGQATDLRWLRKKDGSRFYADGTLEGLRDEGGRLRGFAKVLRDATERKALEEEREALLAEARGRAGREALINQVGQVLLAKTDPAIFQAHAVALLGEALGVDRCWLSTWDATGDQVGVSEDYRRADLPRIAGQYNASEYALVVDALFAHGTAMISDLRSSGLPDTAIAAMKDFTIRSVLAVPIFDGEERLVAALWAAMADEPRVWTPEEASLVQIVAVLTRAAVEAARVAERERNIAVQLQAALIPTIPAHVPGMALTKYYEATLAEARVGGDFYDVFAMEKGCTALIVGDLSGKGLAAAAQVATVRNMLRYALYRSRTVVGAIRSLNSLLAEQHLLTGFATLFASVYDSGAMTLIYVNCGQEPALVLRASGPVEPLAPTGPVLGMFEGADFEERAVTLGPGDALAVFTDGLTEAGKSRAEMLGIQGVMTLLGLPLSPEELQSAESTAEALALRLIEGVDTVSRGGLAKDDLCFMVAVAEGATAGLGEHDAH